MKRRAFTIIELLVVVSIIALLVGILLPAIGKARDQAQVTKSEGNMRNLGVAHATYAGDWNDRQITFARDALGAYGSVANYNAQVAEHPGIVLGWAQGGLWGFWMNHPGNHSLVEPIRFQGSQEGFGSFRCVNAQQFNQYVSRRFYDPVFYAPKDRIAMDLVEPCLQDPGEFCFVDSSSVYWSSYVLSPAAMFSPAVMSARNLTPTPWTPAGFRCPSMGQARYPDLKTHMIEHHWLQNSRGDCNPGFAGGNYPGGCEPYYFNQGWESAPVALFFDGHVDGCSVQEATAANNRYKSQNSLGVSDSGLWNVLCMGAAGYFSDVSYDWSRTSYHVLTTDGILGRDVFGGI
jgi:prepilin-type N-terminal cleavage/methylation domain-containing protein